MGVANRHEEACVRSHAHFKASVFFVPETADRIRHEGKPILPPAGVFRRFVQLEKSAGEKRVVGQHSGNGGFSADISMSQFSLSVPQRFVNEIRRVNRAVDVLLASAEPAGAGKRGDRKTVPVGQDLFVPEGTTLRVPFRKQRLHAGGKPLFDPCGRKTHQRGEFFGGF